MHPLNIKLFKYLTSSCCILFLYSRNLLLNLLELVLRKWRGILPASWQKKLAFST